MFRWNLTSRSVQVQSPASIAGTYEMKRAAFGPQAGKVSGAVVYSDHSEGCDQPPIVNGSSLSGNIALIDRGNCLFIEKVKNAQDEGAIGVIIVNNLPNSTIFIMGGSDPSITIPSAFVSKETKRGVSDGVRIADH